MADPAATLRALADACVDCDQLDDAEPGTLECFVAQRHTLGLALPCPGWTASARELRTMADTVDRLTRERDEARAEVERLRAVIDNPGDVAAQISIVGFDRVRLAHAETVSVTLTSAMLRDHLRARLGVSDVG